MMPRAASLSPDNYSSKIEEKKIYNQIVVNDNCYRCRIAVTNFVAGGDFNLENNFPDREKTVWQKISSQL